MHSMAWHKIVYRPQPAWVLCVTYHGQQCAALALVQAIWKPLSCALLGPRTSALQAVGLSHTALPCSSAHFTSTSPPCRWWTHPDCHAQPG